jgi:hypothetical protein
MLMSLDKAIAIWGAVTGTAALLVHLRNFLKDRPRVRVRTLLRTSERSSNEQFEILASNIGRRPISTEAVLIQVRDTVSARRKARRPHQEECHSEIAQRELKEGTGVTFRLNDLLPTFWEYEYHEIYRVGVRDLSGKVWWSRRRTGESSSYEARKQIEVAKAELRPHPDSLCSEVLLLLKDRRGYALVSTDKRIGSQRYRLRWQAIRAFERENEAISTRMQGAASQRDEAPNTGPQPDDTASAAPRG